MPPKGQTLKDTPPSEEANASPVEGDINAQVAAVILHLEK